jgi:hypothetical protein
MLRVVLTYKARVVCALGVKDGAVSKCVIKCVIRGALRTRRGQHRGCPLRGCHTSSDGCSRREKKGRGSMECFLIFIEIRAQSGLSRGREGYQAPVDTGGRVDKRIEAKSSVPYMGTWDGRSQWCNRLSEGDRYYDPNLG